MTHFQRKKNIIHTFILTTLLTSGLAIASTTNDIIMEEKPSQALDKEASKEIIKLLSCGAALKIYLQEHFPGPQKIEALCKKFAPLFTHCPLAFKSLIDSYFAQKIIIEPNGFATHCFALLVNDQNKTDAVSVTLAHLIAQETTPLITTTALLNVLVNSPSGELFKSRLENPKNWCIKYISKNWLLLIPHPPQELQSDNKALSDKEPPSKEELSLGFFAQHLPTVSLGLVDSSPCTKTGTKLVKELLKKLKKHRLLIPRSYYDHFNKTASKKIPYPRFATFIEGHGLAIMTPREAHPASIILGAHLKGWQELIVWLSNNIRPSIAFSSSCGNAVFFSLVSSFPWVTSTYTNVLSSRQKAPIFSLFFNELFKEHPNLPYACSLIFDSIFDANTKINESLICSGQIPLFHFPFNKKNLFCVNDNELSRIVHTHAENIDYTQPTSSNRFAGVLILLNKTINSLTITPATKKQSNSSGIKPIPAIVAGLPWSHICSIKNFNAPHLTTKEVVMALLLPLIGKTNAQAFSIKNLTTLDDSTSTLFVIKQRKQDFWLNKALALNKKTQKFQEWFFLRPVCGRGVGAILESDFPSGNKLSFIKARISEQVYQNELMILAEQELALSSTSTSQKKGNV